MHPPHDRDFFTLRTEHFTIEGRSRAGHESWYRVRELGIALELGRCPDALIGVPDVFVTHAHLDHAAGIPFYAGQRRLQRLDGGRVHLPDETIEDYRALMAIHSRLEGTPYDVELIGMKPGDEREIGRGLRVRAHRATHRVPARAWEFLDRRHHLRKEYEGKSAEELAALRRGGATIVDESLHSVLFYTGDTDRGILEENRAIFRSEVLILECSFIDPDHVDRAAKYRHIHFDDVAEFAGMFDNQVILLTHFSRRHDAAEVHAVLSRRCPAILRDRIRLAFPEPWQRI